MIRYRTSLDTSGISDMKAKIRNLPVVSNKAMAQAVETNKSFALAELRDMPQRRPVPRSEFTPKQWRYLWASGILKRDSDGNIIPYKRTGALVGAWSLYAIDTPTGGTFVFQNTSSAARYVIGTLARNFNAATRWQQNFHKKTGWQAATLTAQFWQESILESYRNLMLSSWSGTRVKGRAFTSPRA